MNDYHLDPPEYPEIPECCNDEMDVSESGDCTCSHCGKTIIAIDFEEGPEPEEWKCDACGLRYPCKCEDGYHGPEKCPHNNEWSNCDACDHASDIAHDAAREGKR
jgi:hypothetical protein